MSWEIMLFLSVVVVCASVIYMNHEWIESQKPAKWKQIDTTLDELRSRIQAIESNHSDIAKLAEESKRLISQSNLAMGFSVRGKK